MLCGATRFADVDLGPRNQPRPTLSYDGCHPHSTLNVLGTRRVLLIRWVHNPRRGVFTLTSPATPASAPAATTAAARAVDLTKVYGSGDTRVVALDAVSCSFERAQFTAIMG